MTDYVWSMGAVIHATAQAIPVSLTTLGAYQAGIADTRENRRD
jgi:hypothetical protein